MSPLEQSAKVAVSFMDAMKAQPLSLALCVMNFALIGFIYLMSTQYNHQRSENVKMIFQIQSEVQKLLAQCVVPPPGR
jgi:hypothetical protein